MKAVLTTLLLLISSGAGAQTASSRMEQIAVSGPPAAQTDAAAVSAPLSYSSSRTTLLVLNSIPQPLPMVPSAMVGPVLAEHPAPSTEHRPFTSSKVNRTLIATEFWARGLDAFSTLRDLNDPCNCYHESSRFLGLNMTPVLQSPVGAYSYSLGIAAAYSYVSARLWSASNNHPHHARILRTLSRALLAGDSSMETRADLNNFTVTRPKPLTP